MARYRDYRFSLEASLETIQEFENKEQLTEYLKKDTILGLKPEQVRIEPYVDDPRVGWRDVHIVSIAGFGGVGYVEGSL